MVYLLEVEIGQPVLEFYDAVDNAVDMIMSMLKLLEESKHQTFAYQEVQKQMANLERAHSLGCQLTKHFGGKEMKAFPPLPPPS